MARTATKTEQFEHNEKQRFTVRDGGVKSPRVKAKAQTKRFYDYTLLFVVVFLTVFGLVMIYSASSYRAQILYGDPIYFMKKQLYIGGGGLAIMLVISRLDYHWYAKFAGLGFVVSVGLMACVSVFGKVYNGRRRWLEVGPVQLQPTEVVKIALIVLIATMLTKMGSEINRLKNVALVAGASAVLIIPVAINNLSSGIILAGIVFIMLFIVCRKRWPFAAFGVAGVLGGIYAVPAAKWLNGVGVLKDYQMRRINVWVNPELYATTGGYQVLQGLYAIGSGGVFGKGLGESIQKLGFLPEPQNDMIFSIICEELGLFGAISIILIFMFMIYRFMVISSNAPDLFGALLVVGVMGHIMLQVILNIAVVTNTIPNTGITLPFISYGGTSVLFLMLEMGMVLSVSNQIRVKVQ
ncbi:MAG: putative lipid II flippase FtsW [Lachnospiraceae bacterium]|jgi:cell division protein FtsW|nr:putative lipid II flippase FtsW [Lachnospiraceae bacterium]